MRNFLYPYKILKNLYIQHQYGISSNQSIHWQTRESVMGLFLRERINILGYQKGMTGGAKVFTGLNPVNT